MGVRGVCLYHDRSLYKEPSGGITPALHGPHELVEVWGGKAELQTMLDRFFFGLPTTQGAEYLGQEAMIGQYAHGNEPSHHIAWLYAYTNRPETGHRLVSRIADEFYKDSPGGIIGNEDPGQMSAWYVYAMSRESRSWNGPFCASRDAGR
jgi:putative alpha-1,2-mannosidase